MLIDVLTIFPSMFEPVLGASILKRARENNKFKVKIFDIRDYTLDRHHKVDDRPYGGGEGMVMSPQPIFSCVEAIIKKSKIAKAKKRIILLSPRGSKLTQKTVKRLAGYKEIILICGHYEGIDERVSESLVDEEISIGDYVLTGGELPAMVLIDSVARCLPGVLGNALSACNESFQEDLLEHPQYTRPSIFRGKKVPAILLSGNHAKITAWRKQESVKITKKIRPELLEKKH